MTEDEVLVGGYLEWLASRLIRIRVASLADVSTLMRHLLAWAQDRRIYPIRLQASEAGRALYERFGFSSSDEMWFDGEMPRPATG